MISSGLMIAGGLLCLLFTLPFCKTLRGQGKKKITVEPSKKTKQNIDYFRKTCAKVIKNTQKPSYLNYYCKKPLQKLGT